MGFKTRSPQTIRCTKCGRVENELVYGEGFLEWIPLREICTDENSKGFPILCPKCAYELCQWLESKI